MPGTFHCQKSFDVPGLRLIVFLQFNMPILKEQVPDTCSFILSWEFVLSRGNNGDKIY